MANAPPSIQAPPLELPILYHSSRKEDIIMEFQHNIDAKTIQFTSVKWLNHWCSLISA